MYINKINPEYFELLLYAGENSLTIKENKDFDNDTIFINTTKENVMWTIVDSNGSRRVRKDFNIYPFIPFPRKNIKFDSPIVK